QIERAYRDVVVDDGEPVKLHLVMDNYAAHKHLPESVYWGKDVDDERYVLVSRA
nr:hypothetical protein [Nocardioidaceae bacterium]